MMESRNAVVDIGVAVMLTVASLAAIDAAQAPRGSPKSAAPEAAHPRARVTPVWTDHLKLTTYPSNAVVGPGDRTSLVIESQPADGMDVYAPGAEGYKVIALTMAPQPFVGALQYPPSEIDVFAPLDGRIRVYQKPFTLRQELVLDDRPDARAAFRGKPSLTVILGKGGATAPDW
jgi:hypothetical protein